MKKNLIIQIEVYRIKSNIDALFLNIFLITEVIMQLGNQFKLLRRQGNGNKGKREFFRESISLIGEPHRCKNGDYSRVHYIHDDGLYSGG
jgi:hypothetical protein